MGVNVSPATGARGAIRIGEESTYGTAVNPTHILDFTSEGLSASENVIESSSIRKDRGRHKLIRGNLDVQGEISFEQSASGYGMLLRHFLGDYIKVQGADGGIHARSAVDAIITVPGPDGADDKYVVPFLDDYSGGFTELAGKFATVFRDASNDLDFDDNTNNGYDYDEANGKEQTYIEAGGVDASATDYTGHSATAVTSIVLAQVLDEDGNLVNPDFNTNGGVVEIGDDRTEYHYFEYDPDNANGPTIFLAKTGSNGTDTLGDPNAGDMVVGKGGMAKAATTFAYTTFSTGDWIYQFHNDYYNAGVYTHHLERGRNLPTGLTIEVDRDAAVFLYTGCKGNSFNLNFETNSIVTGSASVVGKEEHVTAELVTDAIPGDTTIDVDLIEPFLDNALQTARGLSQAVITIGEETEIHYTGYTDNGDGTYTLTGIPASGTGAIDRPHAAGSAVVGRTSTEAATTYEGNTSPLTSFETLVYLEGDFEEVLAGSITLNNNLNTDKYGLGSRTRLQLVEQQAVVEASLTMEFDDGKHYKRFRKADYFSIEFKAISEADDSEIGTTGVLSGAYYFLPKCKFNGNTPTIGGTEYITHDLPVTAIVDDDTNTTDLVIILVNGLDNDVEAP